MKTAGSSAPKIPFNRATFSGSEFEYMRRALEGGHVSGDGPFTRAASEKLREIVGARKVLLTPSCTGALELVALLLDIRPGDEVIVPAFTFVSTINAFVLRGATPVFADIRPDTLNIDERALESLITPRTRAIVVVHYAGVACDMDAIMEIAGRHNLDVVEDNAHGLFGAYRGKPLGSFGRFSTLSFHETKNLTCGEGGALVLNRDTDVERAEIVREKGTDRSRFFRGQVDKYGWVDIGSSFVLSDLLAACLLAQIERADQIRAKRREVWEAYQHALSPWAARAGVTLPVVPETCRQPHHLFYLLLPSLAVRERLLRDLRSRGILAVFHYLPLNRSPMAAQLGVERSCPVTEDVSDRLVRLPLFFDLTREDQQRVIEAVTSLT